MPTPDVPVARIAPAATAATAPQPAPAGLSLSLPPGGLGPLQVGLVAVAACLSVVGIGA